MTINVAEESREGINPSYTGTGDRLVATLRGRNALLNKEGFEKIGVQALGGTNEMGNPYLFEKVRQQEQSPNGYLIGIGSANVFCMLEAFPQGVEPKAILLFDIDPEVVAAGQALVEHFKSSDQYPEEMLGSKNNYFKGEIFPKRLGAGSQFREAIDKHAILLHRLAKEGRFAIAQVDFTNPVLVEELGNLPDLKDSNNVIYLSNITDHIWRRNMGEIPDFSFLRDLSPDSPYRNYYIDTLLRGLTYNLRVGTIPPHFETIDFGSTFEDTLFQTKSTDEIEGPSENPVWEDLSGWSLEKLLQTYGELSEKPQQKNRREFIQRRIIESRTEMVEQYDEWKRLSQGPPKEVAKGHYKSYFVPTDANEEKELLVELSKSYDYDKDFIPFLAHTYWRNLIIPPEIGQPEMPKRVMPVKDPATGNYYSTADPRDFQEGKIEVSFIENKVPFEELAMSKFYREVEKRLLARNSTVKTAGKNIGQLADELQFGRPLAG